MILVTVMAYSELSYGWLSSGLFEFASQTHELSFNVKSPYFGSQLMGEIHSGVEGPQGAVVSEDLW